MLTIIVGTVAIYIAITTFARRWRCLRETTLLPCVAAISAIRAIAAASRGAVTVAIAVIVATAATVV